MKSIIPTIRNILKAAPEIIAIVPAGSIYWNFAEQNGTPPDITLQEVSKNPRGNTIEGSDGPWTVRLSVNCRERKYVDADALGELVLARLQNVRGQFGDVRIQECTVTGDVPFWEDTSDWRSRIIDFRITYE